MCSEFKLVDSLEVKCIISSKFPCSHSEENFTSILTDRGTMICRLLALKENTFHNTTFAKHFIETSNYILSANLGITLDNILQYLPRTDLYESILRTDISASVSNCTKKIIRTTAAKWSPPGLVGKQSVLLVLSETGSLDLYTRIKQCTGTTYFVHILNIAEHCIKFYKKEWKDVKGLTAVDKFGELKRRLDLHTPTAFTWTHLLEQNGEQFCCLIVVYSCGRMNFWIFKKVELENHKNLMCEFMYEHRNTYKNVSYLHWIQSINGGLLIIGYGRGKVAALSVIDMTDESLEVSAEDILCHDIDHRVEYITSQRYDNHLFIFVVKQDILLIYLLNDSGEILDVCHFCAGNLAITGLQPCQNNIVVISTLTGVCKELKLMCIKDKIQIEWRHLYVNINWSIRRCLAFFSSKNDIIFTFLTDASTTIDMKDEKENFHLTNFINRKPDVFDLVLNNPKSNLQNCYDCFEAIRMLGIVNKNLECDKLSKDVNYNNLNLFQLKTYLYLAKICEPVIELLETTDYNLKPVCEIQTMVEIKLAVYSIKYILNEYQNKKHSLKFMKQSLTMLATFLKEIVLQDLIIKYGLGDNFTEEIFDVLLRTKDMDIYVNVACNICGNDLFGSSCINKHFDNRCMLTMIPVSNGRYKCPLCERYVCNEAVKFFKVECCPFCDFPLDVLSGTDQVIEADECKEDCLQESNVII